MSNIPALPEANAWGLLKLKFGNKTKQAKQLKRLQVESTPIEAPDELRDEKLTRRVKYNLSRESLNLWKNPVHQNRLADQLIFPLRNHSIQFSTSNEVEESKLIKTVEALKKNDTTLQGQLYSALYKNPIKPVSEVDKERESQLELARKMSNRVSEQMRQRLREVTMLQKAKLRNRIKSKNYHRRAKKRSMKEFEKDIALLRQNNPKAFAERLIEADKLRAKERMSLRHKTGGKFAKMQRLRAKYDKEAREAVAQMQDHARDLTKRRRELDDDEDSDAYLSDVDISSESGESDSEESGNESPNLEEEKEEEMASHLAGWWAKVENQPQTSRKTASGASDSQAMDEGVKEAEEDADVDMEAAAPQTTLLSTLASEDLLRQSSFAAGGPSEEDAETEGNFFAALSEAVAEEAADAEEAFAEEKRTVAEEEAPEDLDTFLPGWNRWSGPGTEAADEALRRSRLIKAPKRKRRDRGITRVIIRERVNEDLKKHLVKKIPFPYSTPEQYEAAIAQPVSREWTTELAHKELTKPKVVVKAGQVIRPIDKNAALLREKDARRLHSGQKRI